MKDLKEKTIRGAASRLVAQGINSAVNLVSLVVLARLLGPAEYGLVGMVTAFTGVLGLFRDFGLSTAAVQRADITKEQSSALFWVNIAVGAGLTLLGIAMAPAVAAFFHDRRLIAVTMVMATSFLFNAAGVQHGVLLQRQMRFTALAAIYTVAGVSSTGLGIWGAMNGYGYWALVSINITGPLVVTIGCWLTTMWIPGLPRRKTGVRAMMRFGGTVTLNSLVAYAAYNLEKVLLGRFWGADALGIYGRAYRLVNIPTDNLNSAVGEVALSSLSRVQHQPQRFRSYYLKAHSLVMGFTLPITFIFALFAEDTIRVLLGPKWLSAVPIIRFLAPTIVVFGVINPLNWLMTALGHVERNLKLALIFAPLIMLGYVIGLPYGPKGVALGYSAVTALCAIPLTAFCVSGTPVSLRDILTISVRPLASCIAAGALALAVRETYGRHLLHPLPRLALESGVLLVSFTVILLFVARQKDLYMDLFRGLIKRSSADDKDMAAA
ncbi:MAG TPA: lipopolysaccharide biosynthesis protein [Terracidiphilus sp.]|nr:lipopolysaccharide biosynthesis protein [Terracidiphilus sp.]